MHGFSQLFSAVMRWTNPKGLSTSNEDGSALVAVLAIIAVVSIVIGLVLTHNVLLRRFIYRDVHRLQAHYAAEAGVHHALADLDHLAARTSMYQVADGVQCSVRVEPFGGFARIEAQATVRDQKARVGALGGRMPPEAFDAAVVVGDRRTPLRLTGNTRILGAIHLGPGGAQQASFRGHPFTGEHQGDVVRSTTATLGYDAVAYRQTLERARRLLERPPSSTGNSFRSAGFGSSSKQADKTLWREGRRVITSTGDASFSTADQHQFDTPVLVVVQGRLILRGRLVLPPGSIFIAKGDVLVENEVSGQETLFVTLQGVHVGGQARIAGQFVARRFAQFEGQAELRYPSVAYVAAPEAQIQLAERVRFDGLLLAPSASIGSAQHVALRIEDGALLRGAFFTTGRTQLHGRVEGTAASHQFYFYRSPTHYVNWVRGATVDRTRRPAPLHVPFGFTPKTQAAVVYWADEGLPARRDSMVQAQP